MLSQWFGMQSMVRYPVNGSPFNQWSGKPALASIAKRPNLRALAFCKLLCIASARLLKRTATPVRPAAPADRYHKPRSFQVGNFMLSTSSFFT
jgi:hypothetical protein